MNKMTRFASLPLLLLTLLAFAAPALAQYGQPPLDRAGEQFFIISSVDQSKHQLVLMRPTQVTVVMKVNGQTVYLDENGKRASFADSRAGGTVWVISKKESDGTLTAVRIREGAMSVAALHKLYLDFPAQ